MGCVDGDSDGFGAGCEAGADCDDTNPEKNRGERCDGIDNDCDGEIDDGAIETCSVCTPSCRVVDFPGPDGWAPSDDTSSNVEVASDGSLVLRDPTERGRAMWIANRDEKSRSSAPSGVSDVAWSQRFDQAAVDHKVRTGDIPRAFADQEEHQIGHFVGTGESPCCEATL